MKAFVYGAQGAEITEVAKPAPKGTQVLVRVRACGLNRADLGMTKGHAHGSAGDVGAVLGMEWAGEIAELGPDARGVKIGDRVMGSGAAAFAEYTLADHGRLFHIPAGANMSYQDAATLPVALATMHNAVVTNGALQPGQSVLIQGASSGVGLMGMQIAKLKGAKIVIGSSTNPARRGRLKDFGADLAVDSSDPAWVKQVLDAPPCRLQLRPARRAPHQLYRRHLPHPLDRGDPRDLRPGSQGYLASRGIAPTAIAHRQGVCIRRHRQGVRAHGSQPASRQDCRDAVARAPIQVGTIRNKCCCK
jgi:D-arabinose 1-dehydrogenase-like Zn-dependent alcohol dehydrogenase